MDIENVRMLTTMVGKIMDDMHDCQCSILKCEMMSAFNTSNTVLSELKKVYDHLYDHTRKCENIAVSNASSSTVPELELVYVHETTSTATPASRNQWR